MVTDEETLYSQPGEETHQQCQAGRDNWWRGWSFDSASPPGRSPDGRSSWSLTQWRAQEERWWGRRRWHTVTRRFCPTHPRAWGAGGISTMVSERRTGEARYERNKKDDVMHNLFFFLESQKWPLQSNTEKAYCWELADGVLTSKTWYFALQKLWHN